MAAVDLSKVSDEDLLKMRSQAIAAAKPSVEESAPKKPDLSKLSDEQLLRVRDAVLDRERPKRSQGEAFAGGAAQGFTLGFSDEIEAGLGAAVDKAGAALGTRGDISLKDAYETRLKHSRANYDELKHDHPKTFTGGSVAGGILTSFVPVAGFAKGATAAQNIRKAAALGALAGSGTSENSMYESPESAAKYAVDVGKGAAIGGLMQGAMTVAGKALSALKPENLRQTAATKALKASGYTGKDLKNMSQDEIRAAGTELLDKGVVTAGSGLRTVADRAEAVKAKAGEAIGAALDSVDTLVSKAKQLIDDGAIGGALPDRGKQALKDAVDKNFQFNMVKIGQRIEQELIKPNEKNPLLKGELNKLRTIADDFISNGSVSMREGNVIKGTQGRVTNFNSDTVPQGFKKEIYSIIREHLDDVVEKTGNLEAAVAKGERGAMGPLSTEVRNKAVSDAYQGAKKTYGVMKEAADVASTRLGQTQGQREISLTDTIAGAAGLASGGPANAVLLGGMNKLARQYGDSFLASGAKRAAEIISSAPEKLGKFAGILEEAASKGAPALNSTHIALMKDPDYQRILNNFEKSRAIGRRVGGK